jgi:hypothetical protein
MATMRRSQRSADTRVWIARLLSALLSSAAMLSWSAMTMPWGSEIAAIAASWPVLLLIASFCWTGPGRRRNRRRRLDQVEADDMRMFGDVDVGGIGEDRVIDLGGGVDGTGVGTRVDRRILGGRAVLMPLFCWTWKAPLAAKKARSSIALVASTSACFAALNSVVDSEVVSDASVRAPPWAASSSASADTVAYIRCFIVELLRKSRPPGRPMGKDRNAPLSKQRGGGSATSVPGHPGLFTIAIRPGNTLVVSASTCALRAVRPQSSRISVTAS